jgi:hypothetical protein
VEDFETRIMEEVKETRRFEDNRESEAFVNGLKRALVLAVGRERAEKVFAAHDESY